MAKSKAYTFTLKRKELIAVIAGIIVTYVMVFLLGYTLGKESTPDKLLVSQGYVESEPSNWIPPAPSHEEPQENTAPPIALPENNNTANESTPKGEIEIPVKPIKTPPSVSAPVRFFVQAGAFSKSSSAERLKERLQQKGYKVTIMKVNNLFKVLIGPFSTIEEAKKNKKKLVRDERIYGYIVKY